MEPHKSRFCYRKNIRWQGYDYRQPGVYFLTIVTHLRRRLFGSISQGRMFPSDLGYLVEWAWFENAEVRPGITLLPDEFVLMPDHLHGIVVIDNPQAPNSPSLASIVRGFKATVSRYASLSLRPVWQRNYYEHVVRDDISRERIRVYIQQNPAMWCNHRRGA